jgi:outer membrane protein assembly factor BamB
MASPRNSRVVLWALTFGASFALLVPSAPLHAAEEPEAADWPMVRHDAQNTRATKDEVKPPLKLAWTRVESEALQKRGYNLSPMVGGDGMLYVGEEILHGGQRYLLCLRVETGEIVWKHELPGSPGAPTLKDEVVYCPWMPYGLDKVDARTGELLGRIDTSPAWFGFPFVHDGGLLYRSCPLLAPPERTPFQGWDPAGPVLDSAPYEPGDRKEWRKGVLPDGTIGWYVAVPPFAEDLDSLPRRTGQMHVWRFLEAWPYGWYGHTVEPLTGRVPPSPDNPDGVVAVLQPDTLTGACMFSPPRELRPPSSPSLPVQTGGCPTVGLDEQRVYLLYYGSLFGLPLDMTAREEDWWWRDCGAACLHAVNITRRGLMKRVTPISQVLPVPDYRSPVVGADAIYVSFTMQDGSGERGIAALDKTSGAILWRADAPVSRSHGWKPRKARSRTQSVSSVSGELVLADGMLFFPFGMATLGALEAATGRLVWSTQVFPYSSAVVAGDVLYVACRKQTKPNEETNCRLVALDCKDGRELWRSDYLEPWIKNMIVLDGAVITNSNHVLRAWVPTGDVDKDDNAEQVTAAASPLP